MIKKLNLLYTQLVPIRILAINEKHVAIYNKHILNVEATNCKDETRYQDHAFKMIDIHDYDIILGYP